MSSNPFDNAPPAPPKPPAPPAPPPPGSVGVSPASSPASDDGAYYGHRPFVQWIVVLCVIGSFLAFWFAGEALSVPAQRGMKGSLLGQPGSMPVISLLAAAVLLAATSYLTAFLVGRGWRMAGPLAASAGICAWTFRAGPIRFELITSDLATVSTSVFNRLAIETLLLGLISGLAWFVVYPRLRPVEGEHDKPLKLGFNMETIQPLLMQTLAFGALVLVFVPTADKQQAVFGVLASALIATGVVHHVNREASPVRLYWIGPLLVGLIGYLTVGHSAASHEAIATGKLSGLLSALARPLPLDYIGAGGVGVVLGLWVAAVEPHAEPDKNSQQARDAVLAATGRAGHGND